LLQAILGYTNIDAQVKNKIIQRAENVKILMKNIFGIQDLKQKQRLPWSSAYIPNLCSFSFLVINGDRPDIYSHFN
jgi:hypothetical protein